MGILATRFRKVVRSRIRRTLKERAKTKRLQAKRARLTTNQILAMERRNVLTNLRARRKAQKEILRIRKLERKTKLFDLIPFGRR